MSGLYVDESKSKGYTMVAAVIAPGGADALKRDLRKLVLPGQSRIHFTKESEARRRLILSRLDGMGIRAQVFHCATKDPRVGRELCLSGLVAYAAEHSHDRIVIERDESIMKTDRQVLFREVKRHGLAGALSYEFEVPQADPLLWPADAIAWSYAKGGDWKRRAGALIENTAILTA